MEDELEGGELADELSDPLEGRWVGSGGSLEFARDGDRYSVTEWGAIGQTGSGAAVLTGDRLHVQVVNAFGPTTYQLQLSGNTMAGQIVVWGIGQPVHFRRA